jgi:hypothetical protein
MSLYTIVFILVTILILIGLGLFGLLISKLDKWIDRRERLGVQSIYKSKTAADPEEKQKSETK